MSKTIRVNYLSRVEGEGALTIRYRDDKPSEVKLSIFEPPRFFEGLLQGRAMTEAPDITARICGICPVAYQMSACAAVENALDVTVPAAVQQLRELLYCGEWIESHVLHMFMLHLPDFLGHPDALSLAKQEPELVRRGLRMKKAGNSLVSLVGGREIHPINIRVGGFYRAPSRSQVVALRDEMSWGRDQALSTLERFAELEFPKFERDYEFVALKSPGSYPILGGRISSNRGLDIDCSEFSEHFEETQVPHSTALHCSLKTRGAYVCGPLARFNLNFEQLDDELKAVCARVACVPPIRNPFKGILARTVEVAHAFGTALRLIDGYEPPVPAAISLPELKADVMGHGCTEAPRGILLHRYDIQSNGEISKAQIIPPTSQNQSSIEEDLWQIAPQLLTMNEDDARWRAEQTVRNYDPCISCATHFLKLKIERDPAQSREAE